MPLLSERRHFWSAGKPKRPVSRRSAKSRRGFVPSDSRRNEGSLSGKSKRLKKKPHSSERLRDVSSFSERLFLAERDRRHR
jgi:hypothetical protein